MNPDSTDKVFHALCSASRRRILDIVKKSPGCSVKHVCRYFDMSRVAVMKHLTVLERANLLISEKRGRTRSLYFNLVPIQMIYERWSDEFSALWASKVTALKYRVEDAS